METVENMRGPVSFCPYYFEESDIPLIPGLILSPCDDRKLDVVLDAEWSQAFIDQLQNDQIKKIMESEFALQCNANSADGRPLLSSQVPYPKFYPFLECTLPKLALKLFLAWKRWEQHGCDTVVIDSFMINEPHTHDNDNGDFDA